MTPRKRVKIILSQALPRAFGYYGGSVALSVSASRRSRICAHETCSACRPPVRFLAPFITGCSPQRASHSIVPTVIVRCRRTREAAAGVVLRHWKLGFSQFRFNLYLSRGFLRAGLAGTTTLLPTALPRFPNMLVSPSPLGSRSVGCPRRLLALNLLPLRGNPMCAETAHYDVPYN